MPMMPMRASRVSIFCLSCARRLSDAVVMGTIVRCRVAIRMKKRGSGNASGLGAGNLVESNPYFDYLGYVDYLWAMQSEYSGLRTSRIEGVGDACSCENKSRNICKF